MQNSLSLKNQSTKILTVCTRLQQVTVDIKRQYRQYICKW